ncbi:MAG: alpha-E domain-containing protein [Pseudomonadota bacterium]
MLSRVAENLYWMTRYMERAEDTARLINAVTLMALDIPGEARFGWDSLLKVAGLDHLFFQHYDKADETAVMRFLIHDERNPSSIMTSISLARENTRTFREVLPWECWEWINELYLYGKGNLVRDLDRRHRYDVLQSVIRRRQSIVGLLSGTMSRDAAFQFLRLGRNIERADMTSRILDVSYAVLLPAGSPAAEQYGDLLWMNILKALSAYQMYRRNVSVHANSAKVIEFVLKDCAFPRTVAHCLNEIAEVLHSMPHHKEVLASVNEVRELLQRTDSQSLAVAGLHELTDEIQMGLMHIDAGLREHYFRAANTEIAA